MSPAVFGHGALRLYLLSLLAEAPRHGYELMQALEQRFGGTYSPSAGTIYPRLAKLEEEGLVTKTVDGRKTTYTITDAGRDELRAREAELHTLESEITDSVRRMASDVRASVRQAMEGLRADLAEAEREARSAAQRAGDDLRGDWAAREAAPDDAAARGAASTDSGDRAATDATWSTDRADASARPETHEPAASSERAESHDGSASHGHAASWATGGEHTGADASPPAGRAAARMAVHDVDLMLNEFRAEVRRVVRHDRGEAMTTERAAAVRTELEAALLRIKASLGG